MDLKSHSSVKLDEIDLGIIRLLQENSRLSFNKIADRLRIAVGTAYNRVKNLEERGVLKGYSAVVDAEKLGYNLTVLILIQADGSHLIDLENQIATMNNVISVYDITGDFDIAIVSRFKDNSDLNIFVKKLLSSKYVKRTVTNLVLDVVKEDFRIIP
jgi:DNA-binding Lrp family transcriptional regulator